MKGYRLAILADIHGNLPAFEAVMQDLRQYICCLAQAWNKMRIYFKRGKSNKVAFKTSRGSVEESIVSVEKV